MEELNNFDIEGLFCVYLKLQLDNGTIAKSFVNYMNERGYLSGPISSKMVEQDINFLIHGDIDFFRFENLLFQKKKLNAGAESIKQKMIEEDTIRRLSNSELENIILDIWR